MRNDDNDPGKTVKFQLPDGGDVVMPEKEGGQEFTTTVESNSTPQRAPGSHERDGTDPQRRETTIEDVTDEEVWNERFRGREASGFDVLRSHHAADRAFWLQQDHRAKHESPTIWVDDEEIGESGAPHRMAASVVLEDLGDLEF